ncbi:tetratricopeptide repeat protein, partial [Odoribacter sp. OttesenSCG-928-L07]|nr:tetratricopeptide repeat protein [Odoribacter sp. OttesenSCG-928-L07]
NAIPLYKEFLASPAAYDDEEYNYANYALGYCYFKLKNYSSAETHFRKFINSRAHSDKTILSDAWNRIGDCYFIQNQYAQAIKSYDQAINSKVGSIDYAYYYKALALGATGNLKGKISTLKEIIKMPVNTTYRSSAVYELANTYTLLDENDNAISTYKQVVKDYPRSPYTIKSKQKLGLLYYAEKDYDEAISYLKNIIISYPGTLEANECLASLKNIYVEQNKVDEYMDFVTNSAKINVSVSEADSMNFASAQNMFAAAKYSEAKKLLNNYLVNFKDGAFTPIVYYYLGECYFMENDYDNALRFYQTASDFPNSLYKENAQMQSAKIYYHNEDYRSAATIYADVAKNTEYDYVANEANIGLMRSYNEMDEYNKLLPAAKLVRAIPDLDEKVYEEAELNIAVAQYGLGLFNDAYTSFNALAEKYKSETGAEAKYFCAFISYINANYKKAEEETFELINNFGIYDYWIARGFILLGDIYVKTDNVFQAKQTYQSIIDNYAGEDLKEEARAKLEAIEN